MLAAVRASFKSLYLERPSDQLKTQALLAGAPDTALRLCRHLVRFQGTKTPNHVGGACLHSMQSMAAWIGARVVAVPTMFNLPTRLLEDNDHVSFLVSGFDIPVSRRDLA